jgi:hypothetical protein
MQTFPYDKWFIGNLLSKGSPSRNLFLDTFLTRYFTTPPDLDALRKKPYSRDEVVGWIERNECVTDLHHLIPTLDHTMAAARVREWAEEEDAKDAQKKAKEKERRATKRSPPLSLGIDITTVQPPEWTLGASRRMKNK